MEVSLLNTSCANPPLTLGLCTHKWMFKHVPYKHYPHVWSAREQKVGQDIYSVLEQYHLIMQSCSGKSLEGSKIKALFFSASFECKSDVFILFVQ